MQINYSLRKKISFFALVLILSSTALAGQRTARVGDPSGSSSPKMTKGRKTTLTPQRIKDDFDMYRPITQYLNISNFEQFKNDYKDANTSNTLYPGQFVAAHVTAKLVSERYPTISIKPAELINGAQAKPPVSPLQILQLKGLTEKEAREILKETAAKINANKIKTK